MDYSTFELSEQTCCGLICLLIYRDQSLLLRLPANQQKKEEKKKKKLKQSQQTMILFSGVCVRDLV